MICMILCCLGDTKALRYGLQRQLFIFETHCVPAMCPDQRKKGVTCIVPERTGCDGCSADLLMSLAPAPLTAKQGAFKTADGIRSCRRVFFFGGHDTTGHTMAWTL